MEATYELIDFDNHYYEPHDSFTKYMPSTTMDLAVNIRPREDGLGRVFIGDTPYGFFRITHIDYVSAPGSLRDYFDSKADKPDDTGAGGVTADALIDVLAHPDMFQAEARLEVLKKQGVDATVMLPSLVTAIIQGIGRDVETAYANVEALNRWIEAEWGYRREGAIFSTPVLTLLDPHRAVAELDRVLTAGARIVSMVPGPVGGRSPADPVFDPFWARLVEANVPMAFHLGDSGFHRMYAPFWGENPDVPSHHLSPLQNFLCITDRPIVDTLAAMILQNLFGRFPELQVVSIENGSNWAPEMLKRMDKAWGSNRKSVTIGGVVTERPSDTFRRNISIVPFPEDDIEKLVATIGADRVLMGSDYPHPEGLAHPDEFAARLNGLPEEDQRRILCTNAAQLLGLQ